MIGIFKILKRGGAKARGMWTSRRGNIALITAFMMIPLTVALGTAYDFTMAESRQDQIDGMADIATLAGVTPDMMTKSYGNALPYSQNLFLTQIATVNGVVNVAPTWGSCANAGDNSTGATVNRTMCVTYTAASVNVFANLLGMPTFPLKGASTATSSTAPNINFYLLMDTSPSMEIAATSAGMTQLANDTIITTEGSCTFGCHQTNASEMTGGSSCTSHTDPATGHPTSACQYLTQTYQQIPCTVAGTYADGTAFTTSSTFPETGRDNYDLTRCTGINLRIDLLNKAAVSLMETAYLTEADDHATYQMAIYLTDVNQTNAANDLTLDELQTLTSDLGPGGAAQTSAATITALEMCDNNHLVCGDGNGDMDTYLDADLSTLNTGNAPNGVAWLPTPGDGAAGDPAQEVLFIVTDGLNDEGSPRSYPPIDWSGARCSAIKARGIRIAVLYTQYISGSGGSWYTSAVQPGLPTGLPPDLPTSTTNSGDPMALAAQQCASPGLYHEVSTDGDVTAALNTLFQEAVATARLLH
jgi:Flp pilus assembly protein TadG